MQRSFLKTAIVSFVLWLSLAALITQTSPDSTLTLFAFYFLAFLALFLPLSVILTNSRHGFALTLGFLGSLSLKPLGLLTPLTLGAWWAIVILLDYSLSLTTKH